MIGKRQGLSGKQPKIAAVACNALLAFGCARLHHVQVADIDSLQGELAAFEFQVSATGVSVEEGASVVKALSSNRPTRREISTGTNWEVTGRDLSATPQ